MAVTRLAASTQRTFTRIAVCPLPCSISRSILITRQSKQLQRFFIFSISINRNIQIGFNFIVLAFLLVCPDSRIWLFYSKKMHILIPKILERPSSSGDLRDRSQKFCLNIPDVIFTFQLIILLSLCLKLKGLFFSIYANEYLVIEDCILSMPQQSFLHIIVSFSNYILVNGKHYYRYFIVIIYHYCLCSNIDAKTLPVALLSYTVLWDHSKSYI